MKICNLPRLLNEAYEKDKGLGKLLKKSGSNKKMIFIHLLIRLVICTYFALAFLGASKSADNFNRNAMFIIDGIMLAYALSPLRHLFDKILFYQYGVVYKGLIRKRTFLFATWKPDYWSGEINPLLGRRKAIQGKNFLFSKLDYTYISNFLENFLSLYMKHIKMKADDNISNNHPINAYENSGNYIFPMAAYGKDFIKYATRHMLHEEASAEGKLNIVYAYYEKSVSSRTSSYYYYIIGIGDDNLHVVPFIVGESCIGYGESYYYERSKLGHIQRNGKDYKWQFYELKNRNNKTLIKFFVVADNKILWGNPFAISQEREAEAFYNSMTQWMSQS